MGCETRLTVAYNHQHHWTPSRSHAGWNRLGKLATGELGTESGLDDWGPAVETLKRSSSS